MYIGDISSFPLPKGECQSGLAYPCIICVFCLQEHGSLRVHLLLGTSVHLILGQELELGRLGMVGLPWLSLGALLFPFNLQTEKKWEGLCRCSDYIVCGGKEHGSEMLQSFMKFRIITPLEICHHVVPLPHTCPVYYKISFGGISF